MQNSFFQAICRVGIFMICAQAIVHFRPNESYEKYLKLLMSIMVLIQLFAPIGSFFFGGGGMKTAELLGQFEKELEASMQEVEKSAQEADRLLQQMTLEEVRRRTAAGDTGAALQGGEVTGSEGETRTTGKTGKEGNAGENRTEGRDEIHIGLDGIEPIKIGQEE